MKAKSMLYLEPEELQALKTEAKAEGISVNEMVRRLIRHYLERRQILPPVPREAYLKIVALGSSGLKDISENHDKYLADALRREHSG